MGINAKSFDLIYRWRRRIARVPLWVLLTVPFVLQMLLAVGMMGILSYRSGQRSVQAWVGRVLAEVGDRPIPDLDHWVQTVPVTDQFQILGFVVLMALTTALTGLLTARLIADSIHRLQVAASAIAKGNFNYPIAAVGIQEVVNLSRSFQRMGHQLDVFFQSLQASEQKFATLLSNVPIGVSVFNADGKMILLNQMGKAILGHDLIPDIGPEQLAAVYQFYLADTDQLYPTHRLPVERARRGESVCIDDLEVAVNGVRQRLEVFTIPVLDDSGRVLYAINAFQDITERHRLNQLRESYALELEQQLVDQMEAILQSEERFRLAVENLPDMFVLYDSDRQFLYINTKGLEISGKPLEAVLGKRDEDLFPPEVTDAYLPLLLKTIETRSPQTGECTIALPHQPPLTMIIKYVPILDPENNLRQILALTLDITHRKQVEQALQESEALNRAILEAIPDLIIRMHRDGTYLSIKLTSSIRLMNPNLTIGSNVRDALPPEQAQRRMEATQQALATGEIQIYEFPIQVDEETLWQEARIVPLGADEVLVIVRGLTEQKRAEQALRESEERFRKAFDDAPIGIALVAPDGRYLKVNQALCDILGYSQGELQVLRRQDVTHPEDRVGDWQGMQRLLAGDIRIHCAEKRYLHKQGHDVYALVNISLVKDQDRNPLYFIAQIQDISDRHQIDRLKDEFISIVSHELRTPLTAIRGSLGLINTGVLDENPADVKEMLQIAYNNSDRLMRLVNDILNLERLESGKHQLVMEPCQVSDLLNQAVESVGAIARSADVTLTVTPLDAQVWAAPDAIIQTLTNLLSNAIKFSPKGCTVWITTEITQGEHLPVDLRTDPFMPFPQVLFAVNDNGRGIPADKLKTIFERFQQVDVSDSRQRGGTGLGLTICQTIVRQHQGQIWAESELGKGSTFYFTIPLVGGPHDPARFNH
ncbi:MAG: PAS domain S-box protein [Synechococcales bacterium]|nr:PAS domain S-box protein [Synechococcales bacterium]